ncbi:hypothetical protein NIT60_02315 [Mammaliicoccus sciuri]|nr:hypothetical protein NIT60_02315 [Mammaliicoccus sciuri]
MFTRIELTKDKVDASSAQMQVDQLKKNLMIIMQEKNQMLKQAIKMLIF